MHFLLSLALCASPVLPVQGAGEPDAPDLAALLEAAVDEPTPRARRKAARALADREDVSQEDWLAAMRDFGVFPPVKHGSRAHRVDLQVDGEVESTDLVVYAPLSYDPAVPAPLMLSFHGTGGRGDGMERLWARVAEELGMLVLAPTDTGENVGYRFTEQERQSALAALRWMRRRYNVDEDRIFASGISRGGHLAWDLALRYPDLFAAIAPMIGSPRVNNTNGQNNLRYLENVKHLPIRDLQGSRDDPGMVFNLRLAFRRLADLGAADARLIEFEDLGHSFRMEAVDWVSFLGAARRDPDPASVLRMASKPEEARAFWIELADLHKDVSEEFRLKVEQDKWEAMDDEERRLFLIEGADERTARLAVERTAPGRYEVDGLRVRRFRMFFTAEQLAESERVEILWGSKRLKKRPRPSTTVLLEEFVERFDRRYLPVAALEVR